MSDFYKNKPLPKGFIPAKELSDAELDKLAKTEADRLIRKFEKRVLEYVEKRKKERNKG